MTYCNQPPGVLRLFRGQPNPNGAAAAELYLFEGDATTAAITRVAPDTGVELPVRRPKRDGPVRLKLLHFNDIHGHFACLTRQGPSPVFSRIAGWQREIRHRYAQNPDVVVLSVSAGDEVGGAIFDELLGDSPETYQVHAGYRLYSELGLDVGVLGNHDFDRGPFLLAHAIRKDARFPILAANVVIHQDLGCQCYPAGILVAGGLRVGFVGLTTQAQVHFDPDEPVHIADPVQTALNLIPAVRPFCDVLVVLSHLGYSLNQHSAFVSGAGDLELAAILPRDSVHLIVGGHTHHVLNEKGLAAANIVNGIPIVQAGQLGQYVGEVDITVEEGMHPRRWFDCVTVTHGRLTLTANLPVDDSFELEQVRPLLQLAQPHWDRVLGRVENDPDLGTDAVRTKFAASESALANFICDGLFEQGRRRGYAVDFAMIDASCVRCGMPVGDDVQFGHWFNLMPFNDTLCLYRMSGRDLKALLQDNALRVTRLDEPNTERGFLHFSRHVRYTIESGVLREQARAVQIEIEGTPIDECLDRSFLVAATSFLRGPAAAWEASPGAAHLPLVDIGAWVQSHTHLYARDLLVDYISAAGGVVASAGARRDGRLKNVAVLVRAIQ